jgi:hypothetical protein
LIFTKLCNSSSCINLPYMMALVGSVATKLVSMEVIQEFPNKRDRDRVGRPLLTAM